MMDNVTGRSHSIAILVEAEDIIWEFVLLCYAVLGLYFMLLYYILLACYVMLCYAPMLCYYGMLSYAMVRYVVMSWSYAKSSHITL